MYKGQRALAGFRKKVMQLLCDYGYICHTRSQRNDKWYDKDKVYDSYYIDTFDGPDVAGLVFENDLKRFNKGEAYWRTETYTSHVHMLPHKQRPDRNPRWTLDECQERFYEWLTCGIEFEYRNTRNRKCYDTVRFVDYQHPENNIFRAEERWQGTLPDGFLWDIIVTVNTMPLVCVVMQPTTDGHDVCEEAYETLLSQLTCDDTLSTYVQLCIVTDGQRTLVGSPTDTFENYKPWDSLMGEEPDKTPDPMTAFRSLLRPDRLLEVIMHHNRVMWDEEHHLHKMLADCHQFFGIQAAVQAIMKYVEHPDDANRELGHIRLLKEEEYATWSVFGGQAGTMCQLLEDRLHMLPEWYASECDWAIVQTERMPNPNEIEELRDNAWVLFIVHPNLTTADCRKLLQQLPNAIVLQVAEVRRGPVLDDFCGPCLYQPQTPLLL